MGYTIDLEEEATEGQRALDLLQDKMLPGVFEYSRRFLKSVPNVTPTKYPNFARALCWLGGRHRVVIESKPLDDKRVMIRLNLSLGWFPGGYREQAVEKIGRQLQNSPYHLVFDDELFDFNELTARQDLIFHDSDFRDDDAHLLWSSIAYLVEYSINFHWFCILEIPTRLSPSDVARFEIPHRSLPQASLRGFIEKSIEDNHVYDRANTLAWSAMAIGEWDIVFELLETYERYLPRRKNTILRVHTMVQLEYYDEAVKVAEANGVKDGRFPGQHHLSAAYLHALIFSGQTDKALEILSGDLPYELDFYDYMRGLAHSQNGDDEAAGPYMRKYF